MSLREKALKIKALIFDIDGVLTDAKIGYGAAEEVKFFNARDGHAIVMALRAGYKVGALSGRASSANKKRAAELNMSFLYEGVSDKKLGFGLLLKEQNLSAEECLFMGDDFIDIPALKMAGIAVTVKDASPILDEFCDFRTESPGGQGAAQEVILWLLKETGKWSDLFQKYLA